MPRLLGLLPALSGATAAPSATPAYGLRACFTTTNPPEGFGGMARFTRGLFVAGTPAIEPRLQARPLTFGAVIGAKLDFTRGRYLINRETS
ncbi:hypothetical protein HMPREF9946_02562 [Acetobacteraceae bacterium AT-5844]|nr:hypothetical protein HMPREF9946_02562 [Acetobacteraceae bacterium AT-5844]